MPADLSNFCFSQIRSAKHYKMLSASFLYLEPLYQDQIRDKYKLKNLNYYFRYKYWRQEAMSPTCAGNLDVHRIMKELTLIKQ